MYLIILSFPYLKYSSLLLLPLFYALSTSFRSIMSIFIYFDPKWQRRNGLSRQFPKMVAFQSYCAPFKPLNYGWNLMYNERAWCIPLVQKLIINRKGEANLDFDI